MKYSENMKQLEALHPDYMGLIFYKRSARFFDGQIPEMDPSVKKVGVFVDEELGQVVNKVRHYGLQAVQLHGEEEPGYCLSLRKELEGTEHIDLIKAFPVANTLDLHRLKKYEGVCDYFLFDTKGEHPGGNGIQFNWGVLSSYDLTTPYFLSGGIGPDDLESLREFCASDASGACHAVDVNSRFEIAPGNKDIERIKRFIDEFKEIQQ